MGYKNFGVAALVLERHGVNMDGAWNELSSIIRIQGKGLRFSSRLGF